MENTLTSSAQPLIYTSKGNVPIDSVKLEVVWDVQDGYIKFTERYRDANGEVVKESAHVFDRKGSFAAGIAGSFA